MSPTVYNNLRTSKNLDRRETNSQIKNFAQDEYYSALKAFKQGDLPVSHRTIDTNYNSKKKVKSQSGVYDFRRNTEKIQNQVPTQDKEIELTQIPKSYQKQLIDQIV